MRAALKEAAHRAQAQAIGGQVWAASWPGQIVLLLARIRWTSETQASFGADGLQEQQQRMRQDARTEFTVIF
jgi:hypothetical protein